MSYTNGLDDPTLYFNTKLYTGTATASGDTQSVTGVGFQPDWVWFKNRSDAHNHDVYDVVRGVNKGVRPSQTNAETNQGTRGYLSSFDSDGFTTTRGTLSGDHVNTSGDNFVSWNWLAGGTASSNTDGSITSSVSANQTSGFSIVSWSGSDANATIGHGLGSAPRVILIKNRESAEQWYVYHESMGNGNRLVLNDNTAKSSAADWWQDTSPTSSVFYVSGVDGINGANEMIAYCFAEKKGYSKFGSYTGNGNADGTFIYTGFKPAWVMWKSTGIEDWGVSDSKRDTFNVMNLKLRPNSNSIESSSNAHLDFLSNGFKFRSTSGEFNGSGVAYIYMAFAESPFVTGASAIPTTAR